MIEERLALLARFMEEEVPFHRLLGLKVEALGEGECVLRLPWRDEFIGDPFRPAVHGGVTSMLADTCGGAACFSKLTELQNRLSTVDLRVDYLRPGPAEDLFCRGRVMRMGNKVAVATMVVFAGSVPTGSDGGVLIATAQAVYNVIRKDGEHND